MRLFTGSSSVTPQSSTSTEAAQTAQSTQRQSKIAAVFAAFKSCFTIDPSMYTPEGEVLEAIHEARGVVVVGGSERRLSTESSSSFER